ncbi:putative Endosome/lysosome-associated apoptosis and autophagy regulator 1 [Blattamonas nauphoetae]|uniref:Endosome/lysosome-associated apoptosis and autophagy regulator 1 n=1 Tax=Blattamonas nauphoetae TaxID=2049346 RepID=A0ABQ9YBV6_9EUKA|nr:putative Endosome/lysosome-associated apoptosis and autophagy regulator 1 [Blattamonas nauphoetae]
MLGTLLGCFVVLLQGSRSLRFNSHTNRAFNLAVNANSSFTHQQNEDLPDCSPDHIRVAYGECRDNGTRTLSFFYSDKCKTTESTPVLTPLFNISCSLKCKEGQYFDYTNKSCSDCPAGATADYYTVTYDDWTTIPSNFVLSQDGGAGPWVGFGSALRSPYLGDLGESSRVTLDVDILLDEGEISFEYENARSPYQQSYLFLLIDGSFVDHFFESQNFTKFSQNLNFGRHTITWVYECNGEYSCRGDDAARIRNIKIVGQHYLVTHCEKCQPGTYSKGGKCLKCPRNTFTDKEAQMECTACESNQYSLPGSTKCKKLDKCTKEHTTASFGPCEMRDGKFMHQKTYSWIEPKICDSEGVAIPAPEFTECPGCGPGQFRKDGVCVACPRGLYRSENDTDDTKCNKCESGSISPPSIVYTPGNKILQKFKTYCVSDRGDPADCGTNGWRELENVLDSGHPHFGPVQSILTVPMKIQSYGIAKVLITTHLAETSLFKVSSATNEPFILHPNENGQLTELNLYCTQLDTELKFLFLRTSLADTKTKDYVEIHQIIINGDKDAESGGTMCSKCASGMASSEDQTFCSICPPGTFSSSGSSSCTKCPDGSYSAYSQQGSCIKCGNNTQTAENATICLPPTCGFKHNDTYGFDLTALKVLDGMHGPFDFQKKSSYSQFYFDICSQGSSKEMCVTRKSEDDDDDDDDDDDEDSTAHMQTNTYDSAKTSKRIIVHKTAVKRTLGSDPITYIPTNDWNTTRPSAKDGLKTFGCEIDAAGKAISLGSQMELNYYERTVSAVGNEDEDAEEEEEERMNSKFRFMKRRIPVPKPETEQNSKFGFVRRRKTDQKQKQAQNGKFNFLKRRKPGPKPQLHANSRRTMNGVEYGVNLTLTQGTQCRRPISTSNSNFDFTRSPRLANQLSKYHKLPLLSEDELAELEASDPNALTKMQPFQTTILIVCSPQSGEGRPQPISLSGTQCSYSFEWKSQFGCRKCLVDDYETILTDCVKSEQKEIRQLKAGVVCVGGEKGGEVKTMKCTAPIVKMGWIGTLITLAVVVVCAVIVVLVICRLRKTNKELKFQLLEKSNKQIEKEGGTSMFDEEQKTGDTGRNLMSKEMDE